MLTTLNEHDDSNNLFRILLFSAMSAPGLSILDILRPLGEATPDLFGLSTTLSLLPTLLLSTLSPVLDGFSFSPLSPFADFSLSFVFDESLVIDRSRRLSRLSLPSFKVSFSLSFSDLVSSPSCLGDWVLGFSLCLKTK